MPFNYKDLNFVTPNAIQAETQRLIETSEQKGNTPAIDFAKYLINLEELEQEIVPLYSRNGAPVFTRGNISVITGKAKSRKSFLISLLASQMLEADTTLKVLLMDTEQNRNYVVKTAKRIHRLLEWDERRNNSSLKVFTMREASTKERAEFVFAAIEKLKPDFVFVDGVRDLEADFNNLAESSELVGKLMKYSSQYNCHICSVLHENPLSDKVRGHLGSEIVNKVETAIRVVADKNASTVSGSYTKYIPFEDFYFSINESGLPEECALEEKPKNNEKLKSLFNELLPATCSLSFADLRTKVMEKTNVAIRTAERRIKDAVKDEIIVKNAVGLYYSFLNNEQLNTVENEPLPF